MTSATRSSAFFRHVETMAEVIEINPGNSGNDEKECIIDCVVFFYEEGKGGENYRSKINSVVVSIGRKDDFVS